MQCEIDVSKYSRTPNSFCNMSANCTQNHVDRLVILCNVYLLNRQLFMKLYAKPQVKYQKKIQLIK